MSWSIQQKLRFLIRERRIYKKDLARYLGISPQTMTDICAGKSSITLPHLRGLIRFFGIRADWWLDDDREAPEAWDHLKHHDARDLAELDLLGLLGPGWRGRLRKIQSFLIEHRDLWEKTFGPPSPHEALLLGFPDREPRAGKDSYPPEDPSAEKASPA